MNQDNPPAPDVDRPPGGGGDAAPRSKVAVPLWLALTAMAVALLFAALILTRVAGPLYGMLFPFDVPVPKGVQQVEHVKPKKGPEYWVYRTPMPGLDVAAFYEKERGTCQYNISILRHEDAGVSGSYSVARCTGQKKSAGLATSWEVYIAEGYPIEEGPTIFRVYKYGAVN